MLKKAFLALFLALALGGTFVVAASTAAVADQDKK